MQWHRWLRQLDHRRGRSLGERGEAAAARFLRRKGYRILERQWRCGAGELDLVALDGRVIVFVEVKTWRNAKGDHPAEAVDRKKQRRITRAALVYLKQHDLLESRVRFDVIAVTWPDGQKPRIDHIRSAFPATGWNSLFS